jgi:hypothetical protein
MIGITDNSYTQLVTTIQRYRRCTHFTVHRYATLVFSVFISRILATDLWQSHCHCSTHEVYFSQPNSCFDISIIRLPLPVTLSILILAKVKVTLRLTASQSVSLHDQIVITVWQLRSCFCGAPSLTRGRVCLLYMLLALASAVFLGSEFLGTCDHILLYQIWDFPFRRLLRLAGPWWRYSTPSPQR